MESPDSGPLHLSRRALLGGVAGVAACGAIPSVAAADPTVTVMTRNLYLGVDLSRLLRADSMRDVRRMAGEMLSQIRSHPYEARVEAIAGEIAAARPDVVGLQEASSIRVQAESDFTEDSDPNASTVLVDMLDLLSSRLAARGLDYEVATSTVTTDVEVPADDGDGLSDVRLTDRTAVLVRGGVEHSELGSGTFDTAMNYPMRGRSVSIGRGYCLVDVTVGATSVLVAVAHLESADAYTREKQAEELLGLLPPDRPVVVLGDLNSGPGGTSGAYDELTDSFDDAVARVRPDADAYTCCQADDLRNEESRLSRRVDHVLYRGAVRPTAVETVGATPDSRVTAEVDGESVRLWPSDHAGVVATLAVSAATPTPTATATPTRSPTDTETATGSDQHGSGQFPLYGSVAGVGSLSLAALAWYRKRS